MTIASIDIGTNTVLLLIAKLDINSKKIHVIFENQKIPRIGEGLKPGFAISQNKEKQLLDILVSYKKLANHHQCKQILITATNSFRIASNRDYLVDKIDKQLSLKVNVVSEEEEAKLTFLGCTFEIEPDKNITVIDIGGGSTEIASNTNNKLFYKSLPLGVVSLTEMYLSHDPPSVVEILTCRSIIQKELNRSIKTNLSFEKIIAVAGTPTTLACIKKGMTDYDEAMIEGDILSQSDLKYFLDELSVMSRIEIKKKFKSVVNGREDVLFPGTILLFEIISHLNAKKVVVSTKGLRYGVIYNYLSNAV